MRIIVALTLLLFVVIITIVITTIIIIIVYVVMITSIVKKMVISLQKMYDNVKLIAMTVTIDFEFAIFCFANLWHLLLYVLCVRLYCMLLV